MTRTARPCVTGTNLVPEKAAPRAGGNGRARPCWGRGNKRVSLDSVLERKQTHLSALPVSVPSGGCFLQGGGQKMIRPLLIFTWTNRMLCNSTRIKSRL